LTNDEAIGIAQCRTRQLEASNANQREVKLGVCINNTFDGQNIS